MTAVFQATGLYPPGNELGFDLDGDGKADLAIFNTTSGLICFGFRNGKAIQGGGYPLTLPEGWFIAGMGHYGRQTAMVCRHHTAAAVYLVFVDGLNFTEVSCIGDLPHEWLIRIVADLDGNGDWDLVIQNRESRQVCAVLMNGTTPASVVLLGVLPEEEDFLFPAGLIGNGKAQIVLRNKFSGDIFMAEIGADGWNKTLLGHIEPEWELVDRGYFNPDKMADLIYRHTGTGEVRVAMMQGATVQEMRYIGISPLNWRLLRILDVTGNRLTDMLWQQSNAGLYLVLMDELGVLDTGYLFDMPTDWELVQQ